MTRPGERLNERPGGGRTRKLLVRQSIIFSLYPTLPTHSSQGERGANGATRVYLFTGSSQSIFHTLCAPFPWIAEFIPPQRRHIQEHRNNSNAFANTTLKRHECGAPFARFRGSCHLLLSKHCDLECSIPGCTKCYKHPAHESAKLMRESIPTSKSNSNLEIRDKSEISNFPMSEVWK